jgi:putative oxidoreductase
MKPYGATLLRVAVGVVLVMHGYRGYFLFGSADPSGLLTVAGLPLGWAMAWYLIAAHVVGGLMMIAGLWTRWAALANVPILLASVVFQQAKYGFFMTAFIPDQASGAARVVGLEYPGLVLAATLALVLLGGGALAMTDDS